MFGSVNPLQFSGLAFDAITNTPIKTVETIGNLKSLKCRSYDNQSPHLFNFFDIFFICILAKTTFNQHYAKDICCCLQNYCIAVELRTRRASPNAKIKYVLNSLVLCNLILFHRIGKEVIVHKHNRLKSCSTTTLLIHLI